MPDALLACSLILQFSIKFAIFIGKLGTCDPQTLTGFKLRSIRTADPCSSPSIPGGLSLDVLPYCFHPTNKGTTFSAILHPLSLSTHHLSFFCLLRKALAISHIQWLFISLSPLSSPLAFQTTFLMVKGKALYLDRWLPRSSSRLKHTLVAKCQYSTSLALFFSQVTRPILCPWKGLFSLLLINQAEDLQKAFSCSLSDCHL